MISSSQMIQNTSIKSEKNSLNFYLTPSILIFIRNHTIYIQLSKKRLANLFCLKHFHISFIELNSGDYGANIMIERLIIYISSATWLMSPSIKNIVKLFIIFRKKDSDNKGKNNTHWKGHIKFIRIRHNIIRNFNNHPTQWQ